ncbi:unnamed protein product, partial [Allacma fusca]
MTTSI